MGIVGVSVGGRPLAGWLAGSQAAMCSVGMSLEHPGSSFQGVGREHAQCSVSDMKGQ